MSVQLTFAMFDRAGGMTTASNPTPSAGWGVGRPSAGWGVGGPSAGWGVGRPSVVTMWGVGGREPGSSARGLMASFACELESRNLAPVGSGGTATQCT